MTETNKFLLTSETFLAYIEVVILSLLENSVYFLTSKTGLEKK